jgi:hypothetical protein
MKNMKRVLISLTAIFMLSLIGNPINAQNKEEKTKEKKLVIKIDKEENGKITRIDTTILLKEGDDPAKVLEKYGVTHEKDMKHAQTFNIKIDDNDTTVYKQGHKMVWVTTEECTDTIKHDGSQTKVVIISGNGKGNTMHMQDGNVMIWNEKEGEEVYHIEEFTGKDRNDSMIIKKHIVIGDEKGLKHKKVYRYHGEPGSEDQVFILSDVKGMPMDPMFGHDMNDGLDSSIIIVKTYKDGKEVTETKRVLKNVNKEKKIMLKVLDPEKEDLAILKLKENYKKLEVKDFSINMKDEKMTFTFELATKAGTVITIIDANGKSFFIENLKDFQGKYSKEMAAIQGQFFVQVNQGTKYFVRKVELKIN